MENKQTRQQTGSEGGGGHKASFVCVLAAALAAAIEKKKKKKKKPQKEEIDDGVEALNGPAWCLRDVSVCHFKPVQFSAASYNMHTFHNSWRATETCSGPRRKKPLCARSCHAFCERDAFSYGRIGLQAEVISHHALHAFH